MSAVLLAVFGLLGLSMTPDWSIRTNTSHVTVQPSSTSIAARGLTTASEGTYAVATSRIRIKLSKTVTISALLREPRNASGKRPACLFIEGAGTGSSSQVFGDIAHAMASAGIVTLVPDKRLDNYTLQHRDYQVMANDYMTSLDLLRNRVDIDASHTGIYAESEGTWIASVMAHDHPDIGFMILTSPPVVSGRQQMAMAATRYMQYIGAPEPMTRDISKVISMDFSAVGLQYADFPAQHYLPSFTMPLMVNFGTEDISMPIEQGANKLLAAAAKAGNRNVTLRYYPANHQIRVGSHTALPGLPLAPEYTRDLEHWVNAVAAGTTADGWSTPMIAGTQPHQKLATPERMSSGIVHSLTGLLAMIVAMAVALAGSIIGGLTLAVTAVIRGCRQRWQERRAPRSAGSQAEGTLPARHRSAGNDLAGIEASPHFNTSLAASLAMIMLFVAGSMGLLGWYLVTLGKAAVTLDVQTVLLYRWWKALRVVTLLGVVLLAWMLVALRGHRDSSGSRIPAVHGFGHVLEVGLIAASAVLSLSLLAFWGLFTL